MSDNKKKLNEKVTVLIKLKYRKQIRTEYKHKQKAKTQE